MTRLRAAETRTARIAAGLQPRPRRPREAKTRSARAAQPAVLFVAMLAGCGVLSPEEQLLTRFFEASRLHDTTRIAAMSSVTFNPRTDGVVRDFDVVDVQRDGDSEEVTVRATVATPDGRMVERTLRVMLQRRNGRWFVVSVS